MLNRILNKNYSVSDINYCEAKDMFDFSSKQPEYNGLKLMPGYKLFIYRGQIIAIANNEVKTYADGDYVIVLFFCQNLAELINDDRLANDKEQIDIVGNLYRTHLLVDNTYLPLEDVFAAYEQNKDDAEISNYTPPEEELPVAILNTTILTADGEFSLKKITLSEAKDLVKGKEIISAIGHEATAKVLTKDLCVEVPFNRIQFKQQPGQKAICFKLKSRVAEGVILNEREIGIIGYELRLLEMKK